MSAAAAALPNYQPARIAGISCRTGVAVPTRRAEITADFPGADYPPGIRVRFTDRSGAAVSGVVAGLRLRYAEIASDDGALWSVPYAALRYDGEFSAPECTLPQVAELAEDLLAQHRGRGGLSQGWQFGFDLAPARAGVCNYTEQRIRLSVTYCLKASRAEIADTVLHEIAHAIVGHRHHHDAVWKAKAREIGCQGERCHRVPHTAARWVGRCGCGQEWFRHKLQRKMRRNRICVKCRGVITWQHNDGATLPSML